MLTLPLAAAFLLPFAAHVSSTPAAALLGPGFPPPKDLSSNSSLVHAAWSNFTATLESYIRANTTVEGLVPNLGSYTFSVGAFSIYDEVATETLQYHHTGPDVKTSNTGVTHADGDSIYRLASITKLFTVYLTLLEIGSGYWDCPITDFLPDLAAFAEKTPLDPLHVVDWSGVTLGTLAGQMSGIPRDTALYSNDMSIQFSTSGLCQLASGLPPLNLISPDALDPCISYSNSTGTFCPNNIYLQSYTQRDPIFAPWTSPTYTNGGFALLSLAVENITGKAFGTLFEDDMFKPLGMTSTFYKSMTDFSRTVSPGGNEGAAKPNNNSVSSTIKNEVAPTIPTQTLEQSFSTAVIPRPPSNQLTNLTQSFISVLAPSIDISVQLVGNFGGYLFYVPSRLGANPSLDAAADLLVTAHRRYCCAGHPDPNPQLIVKHSRALRALSMCLNDPVQASSSETLCAVMLLLICQVLTRQRTRQWMSHSVGAAQILKSRGYCGPRNEFERILLLALRGPVVVEALSDKRIHFTPQEWTNLVVLGLDDGTVDGDLTVCLGRLPELMQRGRAAIKLPPHSRTGEVQKLQREISALHQTYQPVLQRIRERWEGVDSSVLRNDAYNAVQKRMLHCHYARILGLGLAVGIAINCALLSLGFGTGSLRDEIKRMVDDVIELELTLKAYRPLGALMMTFCLGAAWVGTADPEVKKRVEALALEYQHDIEGGEITAESLNKDIDCHRRQFSLE